MMGETELEVLVNCAIMSESDKRMVRLPPSNHVPTSVVRNDHKTGLTLYELQPPAQRELEA